MLMVVFALWLLLGLPVAVLLGKGIALGLRPEPEVAAPQVPVTSAQADSAVLQLSA